MFAKTSKQQSTFIRMKESTAGEMFDLQRGRYYELKPDASAEARAMFAALLQVPLEDGRFRAIEVPREKLPVDAEPIAIDKSFRTTPPPPQPQPRVIEKGDVLRLFGWSEAQFTAAEGLGLPKPRGRRVETHVGSGTVTIFPQWREDELVAWAALRDEMAGVNRD
jgi:hypothetical protein